MKKTTKSPLWISHRGYRDKFSENTVGAFDAAIAQGFRILETDLRATADNRIVLYHDDDMKKLGIDKQHVENFASKDIQKLRYPCGSKVLFLEEFTKRYSGHRWVLDIKKRSGMKIVSLLDKRAWVSSLQNTTFLTNSYLHERALRKVYPKARFFARKHECVIVGLCMLVLGFPPPLYFKADRAYGLPPYLGRIPLYTQKLVSRYQQRGAQIIAYLPKPADVQQAIEVGVDMILSDYRMDSR